MRSRIRRVISEDVRDPDPDSTEKVDQAAKPAKDRDKDNASNGKSAKASGKAAA